MKIVATSDLHGFLPEIPPCDLLLIAGDICPATNHDVQFQKRWLISNFEPWLDSLDVGDVLLTWGNHDWVGMWTSRHAIGATLPTPLIDDVADVGGMRVWGSPWTLEFKNWAFNLPANDLALLHGSIPKCDIVMTHGPPYGIGDRTPDGRHVGSEALLWWIEQAQPKLVVFGHIHSGQCTTKVGDTVVANVSYVGEDYRPCYEPQVFEI